MDLLLYHTSFYKVRYGIPNVSDEFIFVPPRKIALCMVLDGANSPSLKHLRSFTWELKNDRFIHTIVFIRMTTLSSSYNADSKYGRKQWLMLKPTEIDLDQVHIDRSLLFSRIRSHFVDTTEALRFPSASLHPYESFLSPFWAPWVLHNYVVQPLVWSISNSCNSMIQLCPTVPVKHTLHIKIRDFP